MLELGVAGKVALVTGAGSGIGQAAALKLAQEQVKVAVLDRDEETLRDTLAALEQAGGEALPIGADVAQPGAMQEAVERIVARWQRLDIVFANAGINGVWAPIEELTPEEWDRTIAINLKGTFLTIKYAVPYLKRQGGSVIITASVNGTRIFSNTGATAYSCSKAGQVAMAKMLALELAQQKVRVNVICPGAIETKIDQSTEKRDVDRVKYPVQFPEGAEPLQPGTAEQVARLVLFLASAASEHISGTELWIDAGESLLKG
jgi:NAD(P)-dependent dehydrogenase (short-subunit alcohol dehydrogenase family)